MSTEEPTTQQINDAWDEEEEEVATEEGMPLSPAEEAADLGDDEPEA